MYIGVVEIKITDSIQIILLPLLYALVMGLALYLAKPINYKDLNKLMHNYFDKK